MFVLISGGISLTYLGNYITALPGQHMSTDITRTVSQKSNVWEDFVPYNCKPIYAQEV